MSEQTDTAESTNLRREYIVLFCILILAACLRFTGIGFGLPFDDARPDEREYVVETAVGYYQSGSLHPEDFNYPSLFAYLILGLYLLLGAASVMTGGAESLDAFFASAATDPALFFLVPRVVSALLGTANVALVYSIAKAHFNSRTALMAAFFLAGAHLAVRVDHFGKSDTMQVFFVLLSYLTLLKAYPAANPRKIVLAGVFAGLAMASKYYGIFLCGTVLLFQFQKMREEDHALNEIRAWIREPIFFGLALGLTFSMCAPYNLLDFGTFYAQVHEYSDVLFNGRYIIEDRGWRYHARFSLHYGLGLPLLLSSIAGCIVFLYRERLRALAFLSFPIMAYLMYGKDLIVLSHYMALVAPFLCVTGAYFVCEMIRATRKFSGDYRVHTIAAITLLAPSLYTSVQSDYYLNKTDTRVIATRWLQENLPVNATYYQSSNDWTRLKLDRYSVKNDLEQKAFVELLYMPDLDEYYLDDAPYPDFPDYIIVDTSPLYSLTKFPRIIPGIVEQVDIAYEPVYEIVGYDVSAKGNRYEQGDAFYLPYVGFSGIERPGPNITVYQRKESS
jgi:hypothetical protein